MPSRTPPDRILVIGETQGHLDAVTQTLKRYGRTGKRRFEIVAVHGLRAAQAQLHHYTNLVVLNFQGLAVERSVAVLTGVRRSYRGPVIVISDDPTVDSCTWGRQHGADYHAVSVEKLPYYADRVFERDRTKGKMAIVLAGGGILGGFNEAGSLKALYDYGIRDFDMYIGLSAGACVAALAANQLSPETMIDHPDLGQLDFYYPNTKDILRKAVCLGPNVVRGVARHFVLPHSDWLFQLSGILTTSLLSGERLRQRFLDIIERNGGTNDFVELRERGHELYVMAVDLDAAERRVFGIGEDVHVPIVDAVMASSALPLFYRPVRIDGRDYIDGGIARSACIDTAIEEGADLIVCVNPLVPYTGGQAGHIKHLGLAGIAEQGVRTLIQARLHATIEQYHRSHPNVTILLIEPDTTDAAMFHNPLRGSNDMIARAALHGFRSTKARLERDREYLERLFSEHGRSLRPPLATANEESFFTDEELPDSWDHEGSVQEWA